MEFSNSIAQLATERVTVRGHTGAGILSRIKATPAAKLYLNNLRRYSFFRNLDILIWQYGGLKFWISLYKRLALLISCRLYPYGSKLVSFANSIDPSVISKVTILDAEEISVKPPTIFSGRKVDTIILSHFEQYFPPVQINTVSDATVYGGSNLAFTSHSVLCHDLYDFSRDFTSEELHGRHLYFKRVNRLFVIHPDLIPLCIPKAAAFLDACAHNYAHFITEVLPRINLFCSREEYADIPLIIDDQLHENILEAIATIVGSSRKVYLLPIGRSICCKTLLIISATGYVPFGQRNSRLSNTLQGQFSYHALKHLRESPALATTIPNNNLTYPEKIFVKRDSMVRKLINTKEIVDMLRRHGFNVVDPGKLSFQEQVSIFSHAKVIIGATGAAMANAVFCKPGTEIGILIATHKHMIYKYWPAMLSPFKINVSYLLGTIMANKARGIHGDFVVYESAINNFLAECGSKKL